MRMGDARLIGLETAGQNVIMATILSDELARAVDENRSAPVRAQHPATGEIFYLVSEDRYLEVFGASDESLPAETVTELVERTMAEYDEDDPLLESYQKYRS